MFTADQRFEIFHAAKSHDWFLILKRVTHADAGIYECQVRTKQNWFRQVSRTQIGFGCKVGKIVKLQNLGKFFENITKIINKSQGIGFNGLLYTEE